MTATTRWQDIGVTLPPAGWGGPERNGTTMTTKLAQPATDLAAARRKLARLRDALIRADNALVDYWRTDEWRAFGHKTWRAFVEAELPELQALKVRADVRDAKVVELCRDHGMSMGAAADALGIGKATAHRALDGVQLGATAKASDGRNMSARAGGRSPARRRGPRKTDRTVTLVAAAGPEGLDVREVARKLGCARHEASATLTRLQQAGRLTYRAPERRGLFGVYTAVAG